MAATRAAVALLALAMSGLGGLAVEARADAGAVVTAAGKGLNFTVDTRWLDGGGYRPVKITIAPAIPTIADRTLSVEFTLLSRWGRGEQSRRIFQDVEIPAGSAGPIEVSMALPGGFLWTGCRVRFLEDGREIALCNGILSQGNNLASESLPSLLIVSDSALGTSGLAEALSVEQQSAGMVVPAATSTKPGQPKPPPALPTAIVRSVPELPRRWIEYTNCDLVCLSLDELHAVRSQNPEAFDAMLAWTSAGGNLLVYGVREDWSRLADLESLLKLATKPAASAKRPFQGPQPSPPAPLPRAGEGGLEGAPKPALRGWGEPTKSFFGVPLPVRPASSYPVPAKKPEKKFPRPPQASPFVMREYDLGMVVAIASDSPLPGDKSFWNWLLNSLGICNRWPWTQRHGLSTVQTNPEFWKFQIPGVGLPPINAFRVLITLFVLAIGPLNYWLLRRRRKLQLLVVTIPLGAAAVTLALFGYALLADGLGTRVRVRSATLLDQRRGRAACWARMSYYAGVTPSGGLTFPADVAVLPFDFMPGENASRRQEMIWEGGQHLAIGWLPARTPTQLLTLRSRSSDARLDVARPAKDADGLEVTNRLGTRIEYLLVCAEDGKCYASEGLDVGVTVRLPEVALADASVALGKAHQANKPDYPQGLNPARLRNASYRGYSRRFAYMGNSSTQGTQDASRLEQALLALDPAWRPSHPLPACSYIAIVESSPEVVLGTPRAREEDSFHVILGAW